MKDDLCPLVPKLPEESNIQYAAFLLYCESKSLKEVWRKMSVKASQDGDKMGAVFRVSQAIPAKRTLERWSSQFHWKKRKDEQVSYFVAEMAQEIRERKTEDSHTLAKAIHTVFRNMEPTEDRRKYNRFPERFTRKKVSVCTPSPPQHQNDTEK